MSNDNIVNLTDFRNKKSLENDLARGRTPLYASHLEGKISGSPYLNKNENDFGDRLQRIKTSLEKINKLMAELKNVTKDEKKGE
jgi:hypothetical protein